jgi:hypothetical protein
MAALPAYLQDVTSCMNLVACNKLLPCKWSRIWFLGSRFRIEHVPIDTTSRMLPFLFANESKGHLVIYLCLADSYFKYPNTSFCPFPGTVHSGRALPIMITHSAVIQSYSSQVSILHRNDFHYICRTIVWSMLLVLPCIQVKTML